ncbi:unnamed protein product (macronuclear) [Paramecium tetraurelia]|uniref:Uncharacterized protein n=1 Tax=Paramecium tetraurelia TaxID=5888 RepID=A0D9T8_PARTE|nr:uncharacterized protein GSPATT00014736001 [Paramecium tetraurelia]CAK79805.1 unnamed protein product [Paramecium tetraurelia]|eukprot:XP_001447202.1 hypothetical protein (macronuclear) [Paramecium tetraurelia strain d4-2]
MDSTQIVLPPHHYRWLNGYEYQDLLLNALNQNIPIFDSHPQDIYYQLKNFRWLPIYLKVIHFKQYWVSQIEGQFQEIVQMEKDEFLDSTSKTQTLSVIYCLQYRNRYSSFSYAHSLIVWSNDKPGILLCHIRLINNSISSLTHIQTHSYQTYEEIRNCKQRHTDCITKSLEVALEVEQVQLRLTLFDDDYNYLQQKFYTFEQRQEIMKLYSNLVKKNQTFVNELRECEEVLQRYDSL